MWRGEGFVYVEKEECFVYVERRMLCICGEEKPFLCGEEKTFLMWRGEGFVNEER